MKVIGEYIIIVVDVFFSSYTTKASINNNYRIEKHAERFTRFNLHKNCTFVIWFMRKKKKTIIIISKYFS